MAKLYITDLDGTLLDNTPKLSDFARYGIEKILKANIDFSIASARNIASLRQLLGDVKFKLPVIEINGAYISDYSTGRHYIVNSIAPDICTGIINICNKHNIRLFVTSHFDGVDRLYYEDINNDGMRWFLGDKTEGHSEHAQEIKSLKDILHEQIVCFMAISNEEAMTALSREIDEEFGNLLDCFLFENPYSPGWFWLTIHDKSARKDNAVLELTKLTNHDISDVVVFGDQSNDINMIKLNKLGATGIAVSNAIEEVKRHADKTIGDNTSDSVIKYILAQENL